MKKLVLALTTFFALSTGALAAGGGIAWDKAPVKTSDHASLQNGAKLFVNYCLNCHSAAFMRYNRLQDIGLTEQQIKDNLLFTQDKVGELMTIAMRRAEAKQTAQKILAGDPNVFWPLFSERLNILVCGDS